MNLEVRLEEGLALLEVSGRLDVGSAEAFREVARTQLRLGHHHLRVLAAGLNYLSSAGIRALVQTAREVAAVKGTFTLREPAPLVEDLLRMSGLDALLEVGEALPAVRMEALSGEVGGQTLKVGARSFPLSERGDSPGMTLAVRGHWTPWKQAVGEDLQPLDCEGGTYALGLGGPGNGPGEALPGGGEFLAAEGCLSWLPARTGSRPDYLLAREAFIPRVYALTALLLRGGWTHHLRFHPDDQGVGLPLSDLTQAMQGVLGGSATAFLLLAEAEGLVGTSLLQSLDRIPQGGLKLTWPESRTWLSFCGDRLHGGRMALLLGVVARQGTLMAGRGVLRPSARHPDLLAHVHAAVFPFEPLPSGPLEPKERIHALFQAHEPLDLLHLLEDTRPGNGLGESAFLRGACWFAPLSIAGEAGT